MRFILKHELQSDPGFGGNGGMDENGKLYDPQIV